MRSALRTLAKAHEKRQVSQKELRTFARCLRISFKEFLEVCARACVWAWATRNRSSLRAAMVC